MDSKQAHTPWRPSTRDEIWKYYSEEFPKYIDQLPDWITPNGPTEYAIAFRKPYTTIRNSIDGDGTRKIDSEFVRRSTRGRSGQIFMESWDELIDFFKDPAGNDPLREATQQVGLADPNSPGTTEKRPVPKAVYYALDHHERHWILAFDIDAKDIAKHSIYDGDDLTDIEHKVGGDELVNNDIYSTEPTIGEHRWLLRNDGKDHIPQHQDLSEAHRAPYTGLESVPDEEYAYRHENIEKTLLTAFEFKEWLTDIVGFNDVRVFYSGQGVHIYAFSEDPYLKLTHQSRKYLTTYLQEQMHIPIDPAVTWDQRRVIRLPYSLHTDVSRLVVEVDSPRFDYINEPVPEFLKQATEPNSETANTEGK